MDNRDEVRTFLSSRRARITPAQAGLPARGSLSSASDGVLDVLARALRLDEAERSHLYDLARAGGPTARRRRRSPATGVRPGIQHMLDGMTEVPAYVRCAPAQHRRQHFRHPVVGELHLTYESREMPGGPGLTMLVFSAEPGSPSADGLRMLASWSATQDAAIRH